MGTNWAFACTVIIRSGISLASPIVGCCEARPRCTCEVTRPILCVKVEMSGYLLAPSSFMPLWACARSLLGAAGCAPVSKLIGWSPAAQLSRQCKRFWALRAGLKCFTLLHTPCLDAGQGRACFPAHACSGRGGLCGAAGGGCADDGCGLLRDDGGVRAHPWLPAHGPRCAARCAPRPLGACL